LLRRPISLAFGHLSPLCLCASVVHPLEAEGRRSLQCSSLEKILLTHWTLAARTLYSAAV